MTIEMVGVYEAKWGEGPIWWGGFLYYVDIEGHAVIRFDPQTGAEKVWPAGRRVGFVVPRVGGGLLVGGDEGLWFLDEESGIFQAVANPEPDMPDNRFNDGKCSPQGELFAGTISLKKVTGAARLYRLQTNLELSEAFGPVTNSNGLAWSLDGGTLYYIDTPRKEILAFDFWEGLLSNPRPVVSTKEYDASPDGMTIDADGHLWVAFCHGACVRCYDPEGGKELEKIELPCLETTAVAFGGAGLEELYVTTGIHKTEVEKDAGRLFVVRGLGVKGVPAFAFGG